MKKVISLLVFAVLLCVSACAAASENVQIVSDAAYAVDSGSSVTGCAYARVVNNGASTVRISASCEFYDRNNRSVGKAEYMNCYPEYLLPGKSGYVFYSHTTLKGASSASQVADYKINIEAKATSIDVGIEDYPHTVRLHTKTEGSYTQRDLDVYIENDTDETLFSTYSLVAILDENDAPVFVGWQFLGYAGILPGSTTVARIVIPSHVVEFFDKNGFEITNADSLVYTQKYL